MLLCVNIGSIPIVSGKRPMPNGRQQAIKKTIYNMAKLINCYQKCQWLLPQRLFSRNKHV